MHEQVTDEVVQRFVTTPADLIKSLSQAASLCATGRGRPSRRRLWLSSDGRRPTRPTSAMACDEILVHTYDAGTGLKADFRPMTALAARVLARLLPWHEPVTIPGSHCCGPTVASTCLAHGGRDAGGGTARP